MNEEKGRWLSFKVGFGKNGTCNHQDKFLLTVFKPMTNNLMNMTNKKVGKFIYNRYINDNRELDLKVQGSEKRVVLFNYITFRYYVLKDYREEVERLINDELGKHKGRLIEIFGICNDWGIEDNEECYNYGNRGGIEIANLFDEYQFQISRITLELLENESKIRIKDGTGNMIQGRLISIAIPWAHMLYNQLGICSKQITIPKDIQIPKDSLLEFLKILRH